MKGASRPAHVQIIFIFARTFAYLLCSPDAARRHSEAHSSRKAKFLLNMIVHRFARMCFLLERGVHLDKKAILMHTRTKRVRKVRMLKKHWVSLLLFEGQGRFLVVANVPEQVPKRSL